MRIAVRTAVVAFALALCGAHGAAAQDQGPAASAAERRDQLAKVQELLADPDPLMRLANMEAIIASGDGQKIQLALRAAFSSDDPELRGLAMRAYMASVQQLDFDVKLPPTIQQQYDAAVGDGDRMRPLLRRYEYLRRAALADFHLSFALKNYAIQQNTGTLEALNTSGFVISGDRFTATLAGFNFGGATYCDLTFHPSKTLTLDGTFWCRGFGPGAPRLAISASMF